MMGQLNNMNRRCGGKVMKMNRAIFKSGMMASAVLLLMASTVSGATIYVPDDYWTIQEAIDVAFNGDTIIVRPGVYAENISLKGKSLVLTSEKGAEVTTIDGNSMGSVVTYMNGEGPGSVLSGFTITNGYSYGWKGAGICCCGTDSLLISNNTIEGNYSFYWHRAVGGGIYCENAKNLLIRDNRIIDNTVNSSGGVVDDSFGGGIMLTQCTDILTANNIIARNKLTTGHSLGAGFYIDQSTASIADSTVVANESNEAGGGIWCNESVVQVANTILWGNTGQSGPQIWLGGYSTLSISFSDPQGGQQAVFCETGSTLNWGSGMIASDPLFVKSEITDYHLRFDSPCLNSGSDAAIPSVVHNDFEGDPRIYAGAVDMGADEFHPRLYHDGLLLPGLTVDFTVVGLPGSSPVRLILGSGIQDPPSHTAYGDLYLRSPFYWIDVGSIPSNGVLTTSSTVPLWWIAWEEHGVQALVGPLSGGGQLTNLDLLIVR